MKRTLKQAVSGLALAACVSTGLVAAPTAILPAAQASGYHNQYQHVLRYGDTGTDVVAMQYMLQSRGFPVDKDGSFGPKTLEAVKEFQDAKGLEDDGIVGPQTWTSLHITTGVGKGGKNDVMAVQYLLKHKWDSSIEVDGQYGPHTTSAVKAFQKWAGLSQKTYLSDGDWSRLLGKFERPNSRWCDYRGGEGYNWGSATMVGAMEEFARGWSTSTYGKPSYGRLSRHAGGQLSPHKSHRVGLDLDAAAFNTSKSQCTTTVTYRDSRYDRSATRLFIKRMRATGQVRRVLFNDPVLINEGLSVYSSGHDDHVHFMFYETGFTDTTNGFYYGY